MAVLAWITIGLVGLFAYFGDTWPRVLSAAAALLMLAGTRSGSSFASVVGACMALAAFSETLVAWLVEPHSSARARRARFPPGTHPHPTRPIDPPVGAPKLSTSSQFMRLRSGDLLWWQRIAPAAGPPRAIVVFLHGFEDHSDFSLLNAARLFAEHAHVTCLLVDQPGHGRSDGLHALIRDWGAHLAAIEEWIDRVCPRERRGMPADGVGGEGVAAAAQLPLFAFGSSMGGACALSLAMRRPALFKGLLLVAPMVRIAAHARPKPAVEAALQVFSRVPVLQDLALVPRNDRTEANYASEALWRLHEHRTRNGLSYSGRTRLRTGRALIGATDAIAARMETLTTPFLVLHGTADKTTASSQSEELVRRAAATDKQLELILGGMHGLHYGEKPETMARVYELLFSWLFARC